jgi:hypothetical protein
MVEFTVVQAATDSLARNQAARYPNVKWCCLNGETVYWAIPNQEGSLPNELRLLGGPPQRHKVISTLLFKLVMLFCPISPGHVLLLIRALSGC